MKFTEAQLESAIIELLGVEGYPHVLGGAIERQRQGDHEAGFGCLCPETGKAPRTSYLRKERPIFSQNDRAIREK
jgi:hypothetical protein